MSITWAEADDGGLTTGDAIGQVWRWSFGDGGHQRIAQLSSRVVAIRRVGDRIFVGVQDGRLVRVALDGRESQTVQAHQGALNAIAVHVPSRRLLTGGADGFARVWDEDLAPVFAAGGGETGAVRCVDFVDEDVVVFGERSGFFEVWADRGERRLAGGYMFKHGSVSAVSVALDGSSIRFGCGRGATKTLDTGSWVSRDARWEPPRSIAVNAFAWSVDGRFRAMACSDDAVRLERTGDPLERTVGLPFWSRRPKPAWEPSFIVTGVSFAPDGRLFASVFDGTVRVLDPESRRRLGILRYEKRRFRADRWSYVPSEAG